MTKSIMHFRVLKMHREKNLLSKDPEDSQFRSESMERALKLKLA